MAGSALATGPIPLKATLSGDNVIKVQLWFLPNPDTQSRPQSMQPAHRIAICPPQVQPVLAGWGAALARQREVRIWGQEELSLSWARCYLLCWGAGPAAAGRAFLGQHLVSWEDLEEGPG